MKSVNFWPLTNLIKHVDEAFSRPTEWRVKPDWSGGKGNPESVQLPCDLSDLPACLARARLRACLFVCAEGRWGLQAKQLVRLRFVWPCVVDGIEQIASIALWLLLQIGAVYMSPSFFPLRKHGYIIKHEIRKNRWPRRLQHEAEKGQMTHLQMNQSCTFCICFSLDKSRFFEAFLKYLVTSDCCCF